MGDVSSHLSTIKFKRYKHLIYGGDVTRWVDRKFPACPLCRKPSLWEWGNQNSRIYFRCPNCMGIISVSGWIVRGWTSPLPYAMSRKVAKIESVGNNSGLQNLVGQEYPIEDVQEWASKENGKQSDQKTTK